MHPRNLAIALLLGIALAAGVTLYLRNAGSPVAAAPLSATVLPAPVAVPAFALVDTAGRPVGPEVFAGRWNLVFFGFTHCPDICPITLQTLAQAQAKLADEGAATVPRIVFVSVDPERDTPAIIGNYVRSFGDDVIGITGDVDELRKLTEPLGVYFAKRGSDPSTYSVDHSAVVLVVGPDGAFRALFSAPYTVDQFVHDLPLVLRS